MIFPDGMIISKMRAYAEEILQKSLEAWIEKEGVSIPDSLRIRVMESVNESHGDYASNVALQLGKILKKDPQVIAESLVNILEKEDKKKYFERFEAVSGYVNFFVSQGRLFDVFRKILEEKSIFGSSFRGGGKTAIVEYFQLNTAKEPHVGHVRSALIGDALKRIIRSQGYETVSDTHVGDWGTQFGILIAAYKKFGNREEIEKDPLKELEKLYVRYHDLMEEDSSLRDAGKQEFAKLEEGDPENRKLWEWFNEVSLEKLNEMSSLLMLEPFDLSLGESFYEPMLRDIRAELLEKNVAQKKEDGAVTVDLEKYNLDEAVVSKSDGASTYLLRDLAKLKHVWTTYHYALNVYIVDSRQSFHFRQLFKVAELLGWEGVRESVHVSYGFMKLPSGMLSTRGGNIIALEAVVNEARERVKRIIEEKNPGLDNKERVAYLVGLGALKYFDLSHNPKSDITFVWDEVLNFEGNSGPYLQYTYARIRGILRKDRSFSPDKAEFQGNPMLSEYETRLLRKMARFPEIVEDAASEYSPHKICQYLFGLSQAFNAFYQEIPVLQEEDKDLRVMRLSLVTAVSQVLKNGLGLLGIEVLEEM